jgi:hypothetical protein
MLESRFDEVDPIGNGTLTLPDLWKCLHRLLRAMVGAGGEMRRRAGPDAGDRAESLERGAIAREGDDLGRDRPPLRPWYNEPAAQGEEAAEAEARQEERRRLEKRDANRIKQQQKKSSRRGDPSPQAAGADDDAEEARASRSSERKAA